MDKKIIIATASIIIIVALIIIFFPEQRCGAHSDKKDYFIKCDCLGKEVYRNIIDGSVNIPWCKGICLKSTCREERRSSALPFVDKNDQINFAANNVTVPRPKYSELIVSVYNDGRFGEDIIGLYFHQCLSDEGQPVNSIVMLSPEQSIWQNSSVGYKVIIQANYSVNIGSYLCEVRASDGENFVSKSLRVEVI